MKIVDNIVYYLLRVLGFILNILPDFLRNLIADFIYIVLYYLVKYRRRVVKINLKYAFPEKSVEELRKIEKDYYLHMSDLMIETISMASISKKSIQKRNSYIDNDNTAELSDDKMVIVALSHFGNWEYSINYALEIKSQSYFVYHKLSSKGVDNFYKFARYRFGMKPIEMRDTARVMSQIKNYPGAIGLIADQSPTRKFDDSWFNFFGHQTQFLRGMDKFALKYKLPVIYMSSRLVKRGYYEITIKKIWDGETPISGREIIDRYIELLTEDIKAQPHMWLWSHKRWKHTENGESIYVAP